MATPPTHDDDVRKTVEAYNANGKNKAKTAEALKIGRASVSRHLALASRRGLMLDHPAAMPGFEITKVTTAPNGGKTVTEVQETGEQTKFEMPETHALGKVTFQLGPDGAVERQWPRIMPDVAAANAALRFAREALIADLPPAAPTILLPLARNEELCNQYTITDLHFGQMSWREETGDDYDLKIAEQLLLDWFSMAIRLSPNGAQAILAQIGDFLHFDGMESVTPTSHHVLDSDSRFAKIVRVVIRTMRRVIKMLLEKYEGVHIIMADANHDPASEIWLREMFAAFLCDDPRVTVDCSPDSYYAYEWGETALFYHHGHKIRNLDDLAATFAGRFKKIYGDSKHAYGHTGHLHMDESKTTKLMNIERHATLAAATAYEAKGGWNKFNRDAKVITYSKRFGHVGRQILSPEMVQQ